MTDIDLYEKFKNLTLNDKLTVFTTMNDICKNNDIESLKFLTKSETYRDLIHPYLGDGFIKACIHDNLDVVRYLLTEPGLTVNVPIQFHNYDGLIRAARYGNINIVKYLLTSPDLKEKANINAKEDEVLYVALRGEHAELVNYLLKSPDLKTHANLGNALIHAFQKDDLKTVEKLYLLSPELYGNKTDELFVIAYDNESWNTIKYLIFDKNINQSKIIENILKNNPNEQVQNWFELRKLNNSLQDELVSNNIHEKKNKI